MFVPFYAEAGDYSFKVASGLSFAYWDEQAYASEWVQPGKESSSHRQAFVTTGPKDDEMTKFYNDIKAAEKLHAAAATIIQGILTPFSLLIILEPVMHPVNTDISSADISSAKRESTDSTDQTKKKRKVEPVAVSRAPAAQLEKWASKRQELKGEGTDPGLSEFASVTQMCCLLCKRKFQSVEEIQQHERLSKLHKVFAILRVMLILV